MQLSLCKAGLKKRIKEPSTPLAETSLPPASTSTTRIQNTSKSRTVSSSQRNFFSIDWTSSNSWAWRLPRHQRREASNDNYQSRLSRTRIEVTVADLPLRVDDDDPATLETRTPIGRRAAPSRRSTLTHFAAAPWEYCQHRLAAARTAVVLQGLPRSVWATAGAVPPWAVRPCVRTWLLSLKSDDHPPGTKPVQSSGPVA